MPAASRETITQYLLAQDTRLRPVIATVEFPVFRRDRDVYAALLRSIISQQLSVKAAATIHTRVLNLFEDQYPHPEQLARMSLPRLRGAGLSRQKAAYLKDIARFAIGGGMNYATLSKQSDVQIIEHLTQINGVGKWTVEMLLMFSFNRKDVFAVDDVGIQNAMRHLYHLDGEKKELHLKMIAISENWRPYRTVVCKYLWKWKAQNYSQRNA